MWQLNARLCNCRAGAQKGGMGWMVGGDGVGFGVRVGWVDANRFKRPLMTGEARRRQTGQTSGLVIKTQRRRHEEAFEVERVRLTSWSVCVCLCLCLEGEVSLPLPDFSGVPVTNRASLSLAEVTYRGYICLLPQKTKARLLKHKGRTDTSFSQPEQSRFLGAAGGDRTQAGLCSTKGPCFTICSMLQKPTVL